MNEPFYCFIVRQNPGIHVLFSSSTIFNDPFTVHFSSRCGHNPKNRYVKGSKRKVFPYRTDDMFLVGSQIQTVDACADIKVLERGHELMFNPGSVRSGEQYVPCPP